MHYFEKYFALASKAVNLHTLQLSFSIPKEILYRNSCICSPINMYEIYKNVLLFLQLQTEKMSTD